MSEAEREMAGQYLAAWALNQVRVKRLLDAQYVEGEIIFWEPL